MFCQQCALKERVHIENYASKSNDCRTCKISKGLFLTESEVNGSSKGTKENFTPVEIYIFSEHIDHERRIRIPSKPVKHPGCGPGL